MNNIFNNLPFLSQENNTKQTKHFDGFDKISITDIPDCASKAIYLRHKKTGLEVFHLLNKDPENLFAFCFRTPEKNSTGVAHITEHSVFCGSQKFPLKEPFTNLMNQSMNTFLNAMTYSDKTVYPASSLVKADYFNLMDVYADAVFFPLLKKEAFMQEAHRLDFDAKGKSEIKGVVFNEMKGAYSSFNSVASDIQISSLFPDTVYACDSGGDPLKIPTLTYEEFVAFHKKYYTSDNCLLFLYGNIDTNEQLKFLQEKFLNKLEKNNSTSSTLEMTSQLESQLPFSKPCHISAIAPQSGVKGATVTINWNCGETIDFDSYAECVFLSEVLMCHEGSCLAKPLIESGLGSDLADLCGCTNETKQFFISAGLKGVKPRNAKKVYSLIMKTLEDLAKNGVSENDKKAAFMSLEFSNREITRHHNEPYSLVLLDRVLDGWNYGGKPENHLLYADAFKKLQKKLDANPNFVEQLIKKYLIQNKNASFVSVKPSNAFIKKRNKLEKSLVSSIYKNANKEKLQNDLIDLKKYQNKSESEEEVSIIPSLALKDIKLEAEKSHPKIEKIKTKSGSITLFSNTEETNGISYFEVLMPCDNLSSKEYIYLPLFVFCALNSGWNGKKWDECATESAKVLGSIACRLYLKNIIWTSEAEKMAKRLKNENFIGRDWAGFSIKMLKENVSEALNLFSEAILTYEFTDEKRVSNLITEFKQILKSSVIPIGSEFASVRARRQKNHFCMTEEIFRGITQIFAIDKISSESTTDIMRHFSALKEEIFNAGCIIHFTSDEETAKIVCENLNDFVEKTKLKPLSKKCAVNDEEFLKMTILPGQTKIENNEKFAVPSQIGFASSYIDSSFFGEKESAAEIVLAHYLSGTLLWEKIRTKVGAYGANAKSMYHLGLFAFSTFRDPSPDTSIKVFSEALEEIAKNGIDEKTLERMIVGTLSNETHPHSPYNKGFSGFLRTIFCMTDKDRDKKLCDILKVTPSDIKKVSNSLLLNSQNQKNVIIYNKADDAIALPL